MAVGLCLWVSWPSVISARPSRNATLQLTSGKVNGLPAPVGNGELQYDGRVVSAVGVCSDSQGTKE